MIPLDDLVLSDCALKEVYDTYNFKLLKDELGGTRLKERKAFLAEITSGEVIRDRTVIKNIKNVRALLKNFHLSQNKKERYDYNRKYGRINKDDFFED